MLDLAEQLFEADLRARALCRTRLLLQVGAGAEGRALVGDDDGANLGIRVRLFDRVVQPVHHHGAQGVAIRNVCEGDGENPVGAFEPDFAHPLSPFS